MLVVKLGKKWIVNISYTFMETDRNKVTTNRPKNIKTCLKYYYTSGDEFKPCL